MAFSLKHAFTSAKTEGGDATKVRTSNWNSEHTITTGANTLLGSVAGGAVAEISCTAAGRSLIAAADAAAQRVLLGLDTGNTPQFSALSLVSTDAGAASGPNLVTDRNSASPAANDYVGGWVATGRSSTGVTRTYAWSSGKIGSPTNTAETSEIHWGGMGAGAEVSFGWVNHGSWNVYLQSDTAGSGPDFVAHRYSSSPAANDLLGRFVASGYSSTGVYREFAYIQGKATVVTNAAEYGEWQFYAIVAGAATYVGIVGGNGWVVGSPSGFGKGAGTLNVGSTIYQNEVPVVTETGTQALTNKTLTGTKETTFTITDGAAFEIDPRNGGIQKVTLGASRTPASTNFAAGHSVLLGIADGTAYTITWTNVVDVWIGGAAPTLATTGWSWVAIWMEGTTTYGKYVGDSA